jgi:plastocyanin domain-containing protein
MLIENVIIGIASLGLLFGGANNETVAQMPHQTHTSETQTSFQRLEQPLWVKAAVTTSGLGLIGLEIWWFLLSKPKSRKAEAHNGIQ